MMGRKYTKKKIVLRLIVLTEHKLRRRLSGKFHRNRFSNEKLLQFSEFISRLAALCRLAFYSRAFHFVLFQRIYTFPASARLQNSTVQVSFLLTCFCFSFSDDKQANRNSSGDEASKIECPASMSNWLIWRRFRSAQCFPSSTSRLQREICFMESKNYWLVKQKIPFGTA